jgi:hypothetical protein
MRIDSSGNLYVGTTNGNPTGNHEPGTVIAEYGQINVHRDGGNPLRVGSSVDGNLTEYYKQGALVGSIGSSTNISGNFFIAGSSGLQFRSGDILPTNSSGVYSNGAVDLGDGGARFRDLYLSGTAYVGDRISHDGDSNTYVGFTSDSVNLFAGGVSANFTPNGFFINDGSLREDYDALSGTSPTCNVNTAAAFSLSMSGNTTFTFTSPASGYSTGFVLQLTGNGSTVTWPSSVDWAGGTAPDAPASGETDLLVFWTRDGGTTWYGVLSIDAAA